MTPDWLRPARYHSLVLFFAMGLCSIGFAWLTFDLFNMALEDVQLLTMHGLMAASMTELMHLAGMALRSMLALVLYIGFKGIEHELTSRWLRPHG